MTEKRFYIKNERTIKDNRKYITENGYVLSYKTDAKELCDLLNALAEENEQLKQSVIILDKVRNELIEENEQLKHELYFWKKQAKQCPMRS